MASVVLGSLPLFFVAAGLALLAASMRVARLARGYRQPMEHLLRLASHSLDPLEIPAAAWPELLQGGWICLRWEGAWFGQPVSGQQGELPLGRNRPTPPLKFDLRSGDEVHLHLELTHAEARGERRVFAEHLARVFLLLLETRLHARTEALSAALAERARLSLYLQHDMRNLAQWVAWVSTDFLSCANDTALGAAARRLRDNAPLAKERAERLIAALGQRPSTEAADQVDLRDAALQAARLAGIDATVEGEGQVWIAKGLLARALDNLFSNLASVWRDARSVSPALKLSQHPLEGDGTYRTELEFFSPWPPDTTPLPTEKLFEPFASGRPHGLGLGLYQARKSLREAGGDLSAAASAEGLRFVLSLPSQAG